MNAECSDLIHSYKRSCDRMLPFDSSDMKVGELWNEVDARLRHLSRGDPATWPRSQAKAFREALRGVEECSAKRTQYEVRCLGGNVDPSHKNYNLLAERVIRKYRKKLDLYETQFMRRSSTYLPVAVLLAALIALVRLS